MIHRLLFLAVTVALLLAQVPAPLTDSQKLKVAQLALKVTMAQIEMQNAKASLDAAVAAYQAEAAKMAGASGCVLDTEQNWQCPPKEKK